MEGKGKRKKELSKGREKTRNKFLDTVLCFVAQKGRKGKENGGMGGTGWEEWADARDTTPAIISQSNYVSSS